LIPTRTPVVFLEKAYFSLGTPTGKNLLFEGQPTVHYFIRNRLGDQSWQKNGGWQVVIPVSAVFQVRMTDETSEPVLTPSYRIRPAYVQVLRLVRPAGDPNRFRYRLYGLSGGFTHYSNGQAGCTYQGFVRDTLAEDCRISDAQLAPRMIANVRDGDFSTSYLSIAGHWRNGRLIASDDPMRWQYSVTAEFQAHPFQIRPGGMNEAQARTYGQHQWSIDFEGEGRHGTAFFRRLLGSTTVTRLALRQEQRFGGPAKVTLGRTQLELSTAGDRTDNLGFFVRLHSGYDYYNIQYQDTRRFLALGVMWDVNRLDKLNTRAPE